MIKQKSAGFWKVFFWEFVQNIPIVFGFLYTLYFWKSGAVITALFCALVSSFFGAWVIRTTEPRITSGMIEPVRVTITNSIIFSIAMLVLSAYFSIRWTNFWTDAGTGTLLGIGVGVSQDLSAGKPVDLPHILAFIPSFSLALMGVRILGAAPPPLSGLLISALLTTVIVWIEYKPLFNPRTRYPL